MDFYQRFELWLRTESLHLREYFHHIFSQRVNDNWLYNRVVYFHFSTIVDQELLKMSQFFSITALIAWKIDKDIHTNKINAKLIINLNIPGVETKYWINI